MFESLGDRFEKVFKQLRGEARLTEENIRDAMREVRVALLDADVSLKVVRDFTKVVTEKAVGIDTLKSVRPAQQIVKIVHDELVQMLGGETARFVLRKGEGAFNVVVLLGLQGSGKTTFAGKLSRFAQKQGGFKPFLIACDVYRPAAIEQLKVVGGSLGIPVFEKGTNTPVRDIALEGIAEAKRQGCDLVIIDTAGRLHIDEVKMDELSGLVEAVKPTYRFLVADSLTGQDAVQSAEAFLAGVGIDGVCLTKIDGDQRGGAALSIRAVTGKPIYFLGTGEKPDDLEPFHPERLAQRILGMGDVVTLVEKAQEAIDEKEALEMQRKLRSRQFTLQDFYDHLQKVKKMGSLKGLLKMVPGMGKLVEGLDIDDDSFKPMEAIILSMTPTERAEPKLLDASRRARIARGSGREPAEVNQMLREFEKTREMMSRLLSMGGPGAALGAMTGGNGMRPGGMLGNAGPKTKPKHRRKKKTKSRK